MRDSSSQNPHLGHKLARRLDGGGRRERRGSAGRGETDEEQRHLHRIAVETGPQPVSVTIGQPFEPVGAGGHAPIPGGFAKLFNRVIDCGCWARLPEAGRAVYLPLVRFADAREGFRVRIGLAGLMRHTGLSRSSVKRGLKALAEARLIALVRGGGVAPDGTNRTNVYQLLLPELEDSAATAGSRDTGKRPEIGSEGGRPGAPQSASRAKRGRRAGADTGGERVETSHDGEDEPGPRYWPRAEPGANNEPRDGVALGSEAGLHAVPISDFAPRLAVYPRREPAAPAFLMSMDSWGQAAPTPGPPANPLPGLQQTPGRGSAEPPADLPVVPGKGWPANPAGGSDRSRTESGAGPVHRDILSYHSTDRDAAVEQDMLDVFPEATLRDCESSARRAVIELLVGWALEREVAADLVDTYSPEEIRAAVEMARQARARGRLRNPAGFIVRCLEESWSTPRASGTDGAMADAAERHAREQAQRRAEAQRALAAREAADARIEELDEATLDHLAQRVLERHAARPAMIRLLRARPPRECRLMRAEIAAMLELEEAR